ncbi:MAG: HipA family kinase [Bacteroidota bacterium]
MIHTYWPIEIISDDLDGGSTNPWKVAAIRLQDSTRVELVIKIFSKEQQEFYQPTAKEVIGYKVAEMFDFRVPKIGMVEIHDDFMEVLTDPQRNRLLESNARHHLGIEWIDQAQSITIDLLPKNFLRQFDLPIVYAMDHFMWNTDRNKTKPNLLIKGGELWPIDHEMCFPLTNTIHIENFEQAGVWGYPSQNHLFYAYLKRIQSSKKEDLFADISEYLRTINTREITVICDELAKFGVENSNTNVIIQQMQSIKRTSAGFINALIQGIL